MPQEAKCSRAGCSGDATMALDWRNPKIHSPERVKTWGVCDEHLEYLNEYLASRSFLLGVRRLAAANGDGA